MNILSQYSAEAHLFKKKLRAQSHLPRDHVATTKSQTISEKSCN